MIRNKDFKSNIFIYSLLIALIVNAVILAGGSFGISNFGLLPDVAETTNRSMRTIKLDDIQFSNIPRPPKMRTVGVKGGVKNLNRPDLPLLKRPQAATPPIEGKKGSPGSALSLDKLNPDLPKPEQIKKMADAKEQTSKSNYELTKNFKPTKDDSTGGHFYYRYKENGVIPRSQSQEEIKSEATKSLAIPSNKATDKISNFEIRYERPEGVSEDELNSDEKAYYSFYMRSYQNYYSKIYSNYEKILLERPALSRVFDKKHLLIGKIDYDEKGNIITVRILKSSEDDDLHYFFEETLKQLSQPNPPKIFTKNRKQFSIFYQLQIN